MSVTAHEAKTIAAQLEVVSDRIPVLQLQRRLEDAGVIPERWERVEYGPDEIRVPLLSVEVPAERADPVLSSLRQMAEGYVRVSGGSLTPNAPFDSDDATTGLTYSIDANLSDIAIENIELLLEAVDGEIVSEADGQQTIPIFETTGDGDTGLTTDEQVALRSKVNRPPRTDGLGVRELQHSFDD